MGADVTMVTADGGPELSIVGSPVMVDDRVG